MAGYFSFDTSPVIVLFERFSLILISSQQDAVTNIALKREHCVCRRWHLESRRLGSCTLYIGATLAVTRNACAPQFESKCLPQPEGYCGIMHFPILVVRCGIYYLLTGRNSTTEMIRHNGKTVMIDFSQESLLLISCAILSAFWCSVHFSA